jgi:hypothetical protein
VLKCLPITDGRSGACGRCLPPNRNPKRWATNPHCLHLTSISFARGAAATLVYVVPQPGQVNGVVSEAPIPLLSRYHQLNYSSMHSLRLKEVDARHNITLCPKPNRNALMRCAPATRTSHCARRHPDAFNFAERVSGWLRPRPLSRSDDAKMSGPRRRREIGRLS